MRLTVVVVLHLSTRCQSAAIHKQGPQIINYDRYRGVSARARARPVSLRMCVCVPLDLNPCHIPAFALMGQKVSRSLTTLPVLFWPSWLHQKGCQSSQPFLCSYNSSTVAVAQATLFFIMIVIIIILMIWTNTVCCLFFYTPAVVFISLFWTVPRSFYVSSLVFEQFHWLINQDNNVFILMTLVVDTGSVFMSSFCPYRTNWYSL